MFFTTSKKLTVILLALILTFSTVGVWASWNYATGDANTQKAGVTAGLLIFEYTVEEILPGVGMDQVGQNHQKVIDVIVNDRKYGLNATQKPIIKELLLEEGEGVAYALQHVTGGNLKNMLPKSSSTDAVEFAVEYVSDTQLVAYTYYRLEGSNVADGTIVDCYKTVIVYESGKWKATIAYPGKAPVDTITYNGKRFRAVDVTKWANATSIVGL